jgi:3-oxoacyl-[acyl-carrier protein] reductase
LALKVDVTHRGEVEGMVKNTIEAFNRVQFLFNSAGAAIRRATFLEIDDALLEKTFALNVNGTFYAMQAVLPHMLANKHGVIVNMASMAHRRGGPGSSIHYAAAKGAVVTMTRGFARTYARHGITVNCVAPGLVDTAMLTRDLKPSLLRSLVRQVPLGRLAAPAEVAGITVFLASDHASYITGATVNVSGGFLMY